MHSAAKAASLTMTLKTLMMTNSVVAKILIYKLIQVVNVFASGSTK